MYIYIDKHMHIYIYTHLYIYIYTNIHIYIDVYTCIYICRFIVAAKKGVDPRLTSEKHIGVRVARSRVSGALAGLFQILPDPFCSQGPGGTRLAVPTCIP